MNALGWLVVFSLLALWLTSDVRVSKSTHMIFFSFIGVVSSVLLLTM